MSQQINAIITDFNGVLLSLALNVADVCPTSIIGVHITDIEKLLNKKENFKKFIDLFCTRVLIYKSRIDEGDEDYFLEKDFKSDLKDEESSALTHVLSFKSIWKDLKHDNKQIVITSMQMLCELAQNYFDIVYGK
jgi:hypothetical protein